MKVWLNGKLVDERNAVLPVFDHGTLYGDGVFEGIRIYDGNIFQCQAHIDRLFESARYIRLAIPYTKGELIDAMRETLEANSRDDGYIRLAVTRGPGTLGLNPFKCPKPNVFIIAASIELYPQEMYRDGMTVIIAKTVRTAAAMVKPTAKTLNYLNNIIAKIEAVDAGVAEAIMLNSQGNIAECTGDNIFIVADGRLITPPQSAGVLVGITRGVVLDLADKLGIEAVQEDITPADLYAADECFLTGTAAEIVPVTEVDGRNIGSGTPGEMTAKLTTAFRDFIQRQ